MQTYWPNPRKWGAWLLLSLTLIFQAQCGAPATESLYPKPKPRPSSEDSTSVAGVSLEPAPKPVDPLLPNDPAGPNNQLRGEVIDIISSGWLVGYAYSPQSPKTALLVQVFEWQPEAPESEQPLMVEALADQEFQGEGIPGQHGFRIEVPAALLDGAAHPIMVVATHPDSGESLILLQETIQFDAETLPPDPETIFAQEVQPHMISCANCHNADYAAETAYAFKRRALGLPSPSDGGSPSHNRLHDFMTKPKLHDGGIFCPDNQSELCTAIRRWWLSEFQQEAYPSRE